MKENDYILANLLNPDFTNQDFKEVLGLNLENTQILPYSSYVSSPFITQHDAFKNDDGTFSEQKFKNFYTNTIDKFSSFNLDDPLLDNFEYSFFDTSRMRKPGARIKDPGFKLSTVSNPDRITTGISGRNVREESELSRSEMAQQRKIWDSKEQKWLDYSPNDVALTANPLGWIKQLGSDPLVLATYNEAGEHKDPITGRVVKHEKGDLRLDNEGQYFYETLGDQSALGKQILSSLDILTVDGEGINKYDFIDSDGLDKSVTGVIAKTALSVAPLFIGGPVSAIYSGALIARELAKSLPMLYGMVSSVVGDSEDSKALNTIAAYANKFTSGTSEYSKQNTFTFENIAQLLADVATQWGQQKLIAQSIGKLRGSKNLIDEAYKKAAAKYSLDAQAIRQGYFSSAVKGDLKGMTPVQYVGESAKWQESALGKAAIKKFLEPAQKLVQRNSRIGADASLAYMAIISNTDVYQSMLEHGASKRDAAAIAFGSTLGMFSVDRFLHLGEVFFDELKQEAKLAARGAVKKASSEAAEGLIASTTENATGGVIANPAVRELNAVQRLIKKGMDFGKKTTEKFAADLKNHTTGFVGKAVGEGLEEVSEELVTDFSKQLYELAGQFSPNIINRSGITDVGAWENAKERYLMSMLGGMLGGATFYGVNIVQNRKYHRDTSKDDLIYLVANNKTNDLFKELDKWKAAGKLGSRTLSASKYEYDSNGKPVFLTATNEDDSQNTYIYNRIKESISQLQNILQATGTNLSEEDLFKQMVLSEQRFINLQDFLQDQSYITRYQQEFRTLTRKLIDGEQSLSLAYKSVDGTPTGQPLPDSAGSQVLNDPSRLANIKKLEQEVEGLRAQRDSFLSGEQSLPYTEKMLFAIDSFLNTPFMSTTFKSWLKANKDKDIEELSEAEKKAFKEEYLEYKKNKQAIDLNQAFEIYKNIKQIVDPHIANLSQNAVQVEQTQKALLPLFGEKSPFNNFEQLEYKDELKGESDDEYNNRDTQLAGETDEDFIARKNARKAKIEQYNKEQLETLRDKVLSIVRKAKGNIDPSTQRFILNIVGVRRNDQAAQLIDQFTTSRQFGAQGALLDALTTLKQLKPDFSNFRQIQESIMDIIQSPIKSTLEREQEAIKQVRPALEAMFKDFEYTYTELNGKTIQDFAEWLANEIQSGNPDIEQVFKDIELDKDVLPKLKESTNLVKDLLNYENTSLLEYYFGEMENDGSVDEDYWNLIRSFTDNLKENYKIETKTPEEIQDLVNQQSQQDLDTMSYIYTELRDLVTNDPIVKMLDEVQANVTESNPITQLLKAVKVSIDGSNKSVEEVLDTLYRKSLGIESLADFTLTQDEENSLQEVDQLLQMVQSYLYAAGTNPNFSFPVGHNKVINEFVKNHPGIVKNFQELPTLDQSVADMYMLEIDRYLREVSPQSPTSWISLSDQNKVNKKQKLIIAETKFNKAKQEFFNMANNSGHMQFTINGKNYDLLEGIDAIQDEDEAVKLHKIEDLFYINLHKVLADGLTFKQILSESKILENILRIDRVALQTSSDLNENISYGKLTDFDKFVYLLTIAGISSNEYNNFIKERVEESQAANQDKKIVPLTIQEYTSRIALAQIKNKELFQQALEYIKEVTNDSRPILDHLVFIDGSAGVGKTQVIARNASKFINSDKIWLTAPKDTQIKTFQKVIGKGIAKSKENLFNLIIDPATYQELLTLIDSGQKDTRLYNTVNIPGQNTAQILNTGAITFNDSVEAPELIIIDELTHFSGLELQILNEFAKRRGISIIGLGDTNQSGFTGVSRNIDREKIIAIRSPKLSISLRDVNLQKYENLQNMLHILNNMSRLDSDIDPRYDEKFKELTKLIGKLNFRVYNQEELNGDLITDSLTTEQVSKLYGKVVFVGDINGEAYKILQQHSGNIEKITVLSPNEVQGQEFDFIVVDQKWELNTNDDSKVLKFLQNLYTMMSRGRIGSIFIDNGLSDIIGKNIESTSKKLAPNLRDSVELFIEAKLGILNRLSLQSNEDFEKQINPTTQPNLQPTTLPDDESLEVQDKEVRPDTEAEEDTDKKASEAIKNLEIKSDFPIRIYGSGHLAGLVRSEETVNGKKVVTYSRPSRDQKLEPDVLSDLEIFLGTDDKISGGDAIHAKVQSLLKLKSVILYGDDYSALGSYVSSLISKEELNKIKFQIEVRPQQKTDEFVGFSGLRENGPEGNKMAINGLVYTLVARLKNRSGQDLKITLGLLANPDSYTVSDYAKSKGKESEVESKISEYRKLFDLITAKCRSEGKLSLDVTPSFTGLTHIRRTTGVGTARKAVKVMNLAEFKEKHPYTVVSKPYIYVGGNFSNLKANKIKGRAVVFVTNDTTMNPDDLMEYYITQKESSEPDILNQTVKPKVRMLVLNQVGVPFKELTFTRKNRNLYSTTQIIKGHEFIKLLPFEEDYMGARMLVSLWNYRANLINFNNELGKFKKDNNLSSENVKRIAQYADALYAKNNAGTNPLPADVQKILNESRVTDDEIKLIEEFNKGLAHKVRQFRLGGSRNNSGVYLRNLEGITPDNAFYGYLKGETPIGIYINPDTAEKQLKVIDSLLSNSLGKVVQLKDSNSNEWPADRLISPKGNYNNSLSGLVTDAFESGSIKVESIDESGNVIEHTIELPSHKQFKHIPILLQKIYNGIKYYQGDEEVERLQSIVLRAKSGTPIKVDYNDLTELIAKTTGTGTNVQYDSTFDDILALAFHGTTGKLTEGSMRATDAYFKHGIQVDPMGSTVAGTTNSGAKLFKVLLNDPQLFTVNVDVDMPIFTVTLGQLQQSFTAHNNPQQTQQGSVVPENIKRFLMDPNNINPRILNEVEDLINTAKTLDEFKEQVTELINNKFKDTISNSITMTPAIEDFLNSKWEVNIDTTNGTVQITTVRQHLERLISNSLQGAAIAWDNNNLTVTLPDGTTRYEIRFENQNFEYEKLIANVPETDKLSKAIEAINKYMVSEDNKEVLDDLKLSVSYIYDELSNPQKLNDYKSIENLIKTVEEAFKDNDDSIALADISDILNDINKDIQCR